MLRQTDSGMSLNKRDVCAWKDEALVWESLNSEVTDVTWRNVRLGEASVQGGRGDVSW